MKTYETPQTLQDHFLVTHVSHRVNQANAVESELDEVTLASRAVEVVANQVITVLLLHLACLHDHWVSRLDVVVDDLIGQDTSLSLRQEEKR